MIRRNIRFGIAITSILICLLFLSVSSCEKFGSNALQSTSGGGVILTFDDRSILNWHNVDHVLSKYNWKATFFVSHFNSLHMEDIKMLRSLQSKGHEIASHSKSHLNAKEFISTNSLYEYINAEILPSIDSMKNEGFVVSSFAYPFGARTNALDKLLLSYFKIIRGTTYGKKVPSQHNNFANGSRVVFGLGIDDSYGNDIEYILDVLQYAKENNKIAIFYGHHVTQENVTSKYTTSYGTLEKICNYVVKNNMHFMTMKDLTIDQR